MSLKETKTLYDGFTTITRGQDSGRAPSLIGKDQVAFAINTSFRPSYPQNRPGWRNIPLTGDGFQLGRWQGAHAYISSSGSPYIIASIGGQIVRFDPVFNSVLNLSTPSGISNASNLPQAWMTQAESYLIIQDNSDKAIIFDGASLRRANPASSGGQEVPVGSIMEYNNGRLWVVLQDGKSFEAGDLAYSVTGTDADVLTFTENTFLNGGGSFAMPSNAGNITAMRSVANQDSVLGQGPLIVFGEQGSASINAPFDRAEWQNFQAPIQSVSLLSVGPRSQESTINVNGDLWYRANDGVRSFMIARRDHGTWVNTPLSHEMDRVFNLDDQNLLQFGSAVDFDNRLLCTASPYRATKTNGTEYGVAHRGLAVLDFNPVTAMFDRSAPVWDGIWTGLQILQIVHLNSYGIDRCFIFAIDDAFIISLWELSTEDRFDNVDGENVPIAWTLETRSLGFADQGELLKQLERTERWFENVVGTVDYDFDYRPDAFWGWLDLDAGSVCATTGVCALTTCLPPSFTQIQYRPRKLSAAPDPTSCETAVAKQYRNGFEFQFKLAITGAASLRRFRAVATELPEDTTGGCFGNEACFSETGCGYSPWAYATES